MFNPLNLITKLIKSTNQKELDKIGKIVEKINLHEKDFKNLNDADFPKKTKEFKNQIKNGKSLDDLIPEAFALVREAAKRKIIANTKISENNVRVFIVRHAERADECGHKERLLRQSSAEKKGGT